MPPKKIRKQSFRLAPPLGNPTPDKVRQVIDTLLAWGPVRHFPWRDRPTNPFQILVAEILLARTSAEGVASVIEELWFRYPTPYEMANSSIGDIEKIIRPLGLMKRAGMLRATAFLLLGNGTDTSSYKEIKHLPGVGRYVGDAFRLFAFDDPVIPIDAVIGRVIRRIYGFPDFGPAYADKALWTVAQVHASHLERKRLVAAILDLGALICLPQTPKCPTCPVNMYCLYYEESISSK